MKEARLFSSKGYHSRAGIAVSSTREFRGRGNKKTFFHLGAVPPGLELRHRSRIYDFRQCRSLEVLLPRLFIGVVLARVLFEALQAPLLTTIHIHEGIKELASLLAHFHHICWWLPAYTSVKPIKFGTAEGLTQAFRQSG